jgi:hypothetical protein
VLCAHTVRRLKPGTYEQFRQAFTFEGGDPPAGWVRFHMLRGLTDENEVVTFGFFDGSLEELERSQREDDYRTRREQIDPLVESVLANGVYEIVDSRVVEAASSS